MELVGEEETAEGIPRHCSVPEQLCSCCPLPRYAPEGHDNTAVPRGSGTPGQVTQCDTRAAPRAGSKFPSKRESLC